ncbi:1-cys-glutaredoxin-like protein-1, putative [Plasmodium ovale]|uniref:1-cys-glutaredoxin-like protein-1, putative n=2 Tax=Plasmodium ovale TaxID=36330 RepID=A0A1D3THA3_PLAOA|nr:1-cys-glutaredoxin-like protein-1, putative [Plasmodium ovale]
MIAKSRFQNFRFLRKLVTSTNMRIFPFIRGSKIDFSYSSKDKQNGVPDHNANSVKDEFKDFEKTDIYQTLKMKIKEILEQEKIVLFMKGTPEKPLCGFSSKVVHILNNMNVKDYVYIDVMKNRNLREAIKIYSNWPYIPHLYVKNNFIGGCDIVSDLYNRGELESIVK